MGTGDGCRALGATMRVRGSTRESWRRAFGEDIDPNAPISSLTRRERRFARLKAKELRGEVFDTSCVIARLRETLSSVPVHQDKRRPEDALAAFLRNAMRKPTLRLGK